MTLNEAKHGELVKLAHERRMVLVIGQFGQDCPDVVVRLDGESRLTNRPKTTRIEKVIAVLKSVKVQDR
ncbi:hypothetical protein GTG28_20775 [Vibrio sp. OCN044]|uniref:Uncharacterized protein n=1 Tax=Vibrio tetraodonis subsp. pristinus TaxID=2695891 RepID=A0A6L8M5L6_9VIBR|nr:hypothetical protein [Vibrio tetraodonis]MYM61639.1 hypothetical protein [Vibrio tetraodonis subsp. pristinus]